MRRKKVKEPKFIIGEKVRDIKIDHSQHVFEVSFAVCVFAILLLGAIISLGAMISEWYVWLICGLLLVYFITHSVFFIIRVYKSPKYVLHDNCIVVNSTWKYTVIKLNTITKIETKETFFDRLQKEEMLSLVIYFDDNGKRKATLHCITENINDLMKDIIAIKNGKDIDKKETKPAESKVKAEEKPKTTKRAIQNEEKATRSTTKKKAE